MKLHIVLFCLLALLSLSIGCATPRGGQTVSERELKIHIDLAESYIRSGEPRRAVKELLPLADQGQKDWRYHYALGHAYLLLDELAASEKEFQACVKIEPGSGDGWNSLGFVLMSRNKIAQAQEAFAKALAMIDYLTPELPAYNMARSYLEQGDETMTIEYARISIDKNWRYAPAYVLLARTLVSIDRVDEAQEWLEKGVESNLESPALQLALAENLVRKGNNAEARTWFTRIANDFPETQEAKMAGDYLDLLP
ncbi:MAG: tetratricopeptide repeat protein [Deltaproteobacteria bacterium]|nr:tetratricopeptide repeat protein [Deltaproteobacteria bacterium]